MNKLLEKQLSKFLAGGKNLSPELSSFIEAVNNSYNSYERELELSERAFRLSEEEYQEINTQLKQEVEVKRNSINKLKDAVIQTGDESWTIEMGDDDLLGIVSILKKQIDIINKTKQQQQEQQQFYEHILNMIPADIAVIDKDNRYLFVNPSAIKDPEARKWIIGKTDFEYHAYRNRPLADAEQRLKHFQEMIRSGKQKVWEEKLITKTGEPEYQLRMLHPVYKDNGEFEMMVVYGINITERKRIEEQIQKTQLRYQSIFNNSQALICTHDLNGMILDVNQSATKTFGYTKEELLGMSVEALLYPDKRHQFNEIYLKEIREKGKSEGIMVSVGKNKEKIYLLYQNFLVVSDTEEPYVIGFSQDITARIKAENALKASEEKYRRIIENMNLGLLQVSPEEEIVYANQSFCDMSGYSLEEMIGRNAQNLFTNGEADVKAVEVRRRLGKSDAYEIRTKTKDGIPKWWLISGAPTFNDNNEFIGSIGIHLDITTQKDIETELKRAKAAAEASSRAKEAFLANMSHEIRTPMNAIIGISKLLSKTELKQQQKYYLDIVQNASSNLLVIINDLLDFSKIESGKVVLENIAFRMNDQIDTTRKILHHKAEEKGLIFQCDCDKRLSPVLIGDPYRLNQVLINLLGNSIKFTEQGAVRVSCGVVEDTKDYQLIEFRVSDTGIGMSEEFVAQIFDKFTQEDESISRKFGGTGLGMSISKQLVELMGGSIQVESAKNVGTTMSFTIKLKKGTEADLPNETETIADARVLKDKRLLLVEDNATNRILANTILSQHGAEVVEAEDGAVAIQKLKTGIYDLVLMDMQMPVMNGLDATKYIREHIDKSIPIIALTASAYKQEEEKCFEAGMSDFITKPIDEDKMIQLIAGWLGRQATEKAAKAADSSAPDEASDIDLSGIYAFACGNMDFVRNISQTFASELTHNVAILEEAFSNKDWRAVAGVAHKVKPSASSFNVRKLVPILENLEHINPENIDLEKIAAQISSIKNISTQYASQLLEHIKTI